MSAFGAMAELSIFTSCFLCCTTMSLLEGKTNQPLVVMVFYWCSGFHHQQQQQQLLGYSLTSVLMMISERKIIKKTPELTSEHQSSPC